MELVLTHNIDTCEGSSHLVFVATVLVEVELHRSQVPQARSTKSRRLPHSQFAQPGGVRISMNECDVHLALRGKHSTRRQQKVAKQLLVCGDRELQPLVGASVREVEDHQIVRPLGGEFGLL